MYLPLLLLTDTQYKTKKNSLLHHDSHHPQRYAHDANLQNYLHKKWLANNSQRAVSLKAPDVTRCKPALAIYDMKLCSSLLGILVIANSNIASTQPDLTTSIWLISCAVITYNSHGQRIDLATQTDVHSHLTCRHEIIMMLLCNLNIEKNKIKNRTYFQGLHSKAGRAR